MPDPGESTAPAAERAVSYLREISPDLRGCAILGPDGRSLADTGGPGSWSEAGAALLDAADRAAGEPCTHAHVATEEGEAFCLRHGELAAVAVTERFALASLMFFDMRAALRDIVAADA